MLPAGPTGAGPAARRSPRPVTPEYRRPWAVCSNKHPRSGRAELARLGWKPDIALFSDAFDGPKRLEPVLAALGLAPGEVVFVGDTAHDRACAHTLGIPFGLAGWNARAVLVASDVVLTRPADVLSLMTQEKAP